MALKECPACGSSFNAPRRPCFLIEDGGAHYVMSQPGRISHRRRILHECGPAPPGAAGGDPSGQPARPKGPAPAGYTREALELPIAN